MSRDNGYVIRRNRKGQFVLQEFNASAEEYPSVENRHAKTFYTLLEAVMTYTQFQDECEYGLRIELDTPKVKNFYEIDLDPGDDDGE